ncbi:MAG TPA: alpha/beta hydrolase [Agromyces sp.]|nr:alpha/beta hydrolase [Agromyces sp.]
MTGEATRVAERDGTGERTGVDADQEARHARRHRRLRRLGWTLAIIVAVVALVTVVLRLTPWPSAMLIRAVFEQGAKESIAQMQPYVPDIEYDEHLGLDYGGGHGQTLDVIGLPGGEAKPTVVWIHGGAWISGAKENVEPYLRMIAAEGYTTVALGYSIAPEQIYPTAVGQANDALAYLEANADELGIDPDRIVLAGDSAGSQLASQVAALTTNPDYADLLDVTPALEPEQLVGTVLNCGVYDLDNMTGLDGLVGWGFQISLWAYTGTQDWSVSAPGSLMSSMDFATADFPKTFITGGNGDGLTWLQSIPMSQRLQERGVEVTTLFWPADHEPALPHEYQFHMTTFEEAHVALQQTLDFLEDVTG